MTRDEARKPLRSGRESGQRGQLGRLTEICASIKSRCGSCPSLELLATLVRSHMQARWVELRVKRNVSMSGERDSEAVLQEMLPPESFSIGNLTLGARETRAYTPADVEELSECAILIAQIVVNASLQQYGGQQAKGYSKSRTLNQQELSVELKTILQRMHAEQLPVSLLAFHIDDLKYPSGAHARGVKDNIIRAVADLARKCFRGQDIVARSEDDELFIILWDLKGPRTPEPSSPHLEDILRRLAMKLLEDNTTHETLTGDGARLTGAMVSSPWDGPTGEELIQNAKAILREATETGDHQVILHKPTIYLCAGSQSIVGASYSAEHVQRMGPTGIDQSTNVQIVWGDVKRDVNLAELTKELRQLRAAMDERKDKNDSTQAIAVGVVAEAEEAAKRGDGQGMLGALMRAGKWASDVSTDIGVRVTAELLKACG